MSDKTSDAIRLLLDRAEIWDAMCRYCRGVDRGDYDLMRTAYHTDAHDDHVDFKGTVDELVAWLEERFAGVDNSQHFLGNHLVEFAGPDLALVETSFTSRRTRKPTDAEQATLKPGDAICRESWGRYVDRFERRDGAWRVARRIVVLDSSLLSVALHGMRSGDKNWGTRDRSDHVYAMRAEIFGSKATGST